ncbi:phage envelope protein [Pedobacter ginsengisoli]|uniref:Phage envelope protein n=1 Tax=Pedobacter ginsengisoli TaxID=363852 RepID=A0A2D1U1Y6_9SPHI|nr:DUF1398 family protein [Pedobacter ginsengisoli]ATP55632.1 phage envelope protein [Pedobacter ginsengisoli]
MSEYDSANRFTVKQIETAHQKVKSGADFPAYIREIIALGVKSFETFVIDSHTDYYGDNGYLVTSDPQYTSLRIAGKSDSERFKSYLKDHQKGGSDYFTFCMQCAETGIEKWIVCTEKMTCTYYDYLGEEVLVETIPS